MVDAIFVPEGMEARAVSGVLRRANSAIRLVTVGLGPERARKSIELALRGSHVRRALVTGVCGLLTLASKPGDTLLYATIRAAAQDPLLETDARLTQTLAASLPQAKTNVRALQQDRIVTSAREKARLADLYGAEAVDMESYAGVALLQNAGVRTAVLRVASDGANEDLPNLNAAIGRDGALDAGLLLREMLLSPLAGCVMARRGMAALAQLKRAITCVAHA